MKGLKELLDNLDSLNVSVRSAGRGACNAAAQVVKKQAVANARAHGLVSTGALVQNIAVKRERGTPSTWFEYHIGVRHGRESKGAEKIAVRNSNGKIVYEWTNNPFYWWFWEIGHFNVFANRHIPAKAFLGPAMASTQGQLLGVMRDYLATRIERTIAKAIT